MSQANPEPSPLVLVAGASGYIGGRLIPALKARGARLRCLARKPDAIRAKFGPDVEAVAGDALDRASLDGPLAGVDTAYYLVHLMTDSDDFEAQDRRAAKNFAEAAKAAGVRRIIYLGGLGDDADPDLSPHLKSRHEVGEILRSTGVETIEFRASAILGPGSLSYDMVKSLTDRLPVMICPKWLSTPTQPIAVEDVVAYLDAALDLPPGASRVVEIGGADVVKYRDLIEEYARRKGLRRVLISVPILTPWLSGLWLALVTPNKFGVGRHLIEGLKNPTVVRGDDARKLFPRIHPVGVPEAIRRAVAQAEAAAVKPAA
ncbi:NAD(P)H-binding protein [Paludisphaera mucosa]|uniref:NAD(P)H-binding protein n=1 Tax=Paludisphaera mucosa TaxID=3030827 RepID=A0ABT6FBA2_9BACT|nr:NAD(P)H-binding protein [Paludisphaera mucosa]MDG3004781.1 NAD(P)H-binding protein [Paludisphaera mucosa]